MDEISQDEREKIREEEKRKTTKVKGGVLSKKGVQIATRPTWAF